MDKAWAADLLRATPGPKPRGWNEHSHRGPQGPTPQQTGLAQQLPWTGCSSPGAPFPFWHTFTWLCKTLQEMEFA